LAPPLAPGIGALGPAQTAAPSARADRRGRRADGQDPGKPRRRLLMALGDEFAGWATSRPGPGSPSGAGADEVAASGRATAPTAAT
jgi:hypothetical protein